MPDPLITLTTDFGEDSPYVAALKGVILTINSTARLVDLSHLIPPQDLRHADHFLAAAVPYFPPGTIHVIVVDPGVGSDRALLHVLAADHHLLAPDNGCLTGVLRALGGEPVARRLEERRYWRPEISRTFHGRDILAPVAGHLSRGLDPARLGPTVTCWVRLEIAPPQRLPDGVTGEVAFVDHFGNLITNIPAPMIDRQPEGLTVAQARADFTLVRTYAEAEPGQTVLLVSSTGHVEIAVVQGNAARSLGATVGTPVVVGFGASSDTLPG